MSTRRRYLGWGIFLICVGIVPVAYQAGLIDVGSLGQLVRLWPLVIIAIGLGIALRASRFGGLGGLLAAAVFGLLVGASLSGGITTLGGCNGGQSGGSPFNYNGSTDQPLQVSADISCASFTASTASAGSWAVSGTADQAPIVTANLLDVEMHSASTSRVPFVSRGETWNAQLPARIATAYFTFNASSATLKFGPGEIDLFSLDLNAGDADVDLGAVDMTHGPINATLNAASAKVILPSSGTGATGTIHVNAASLKLCANPALALSISNEGTLSSDNYAAAGLTRNGDLWTTAGYSASGPHVDLILNANVSTINLDRSGECP